MPLGPLITPEQILAAGDYSESREAAVTVADLVMHISGTTEDRWREVLRERLDFLGLLGVEPVTWDVPKVARYIIARHRLGRRFSANTVHEMIPARAQRWSRKAVQGLLRAGLIEPARACPHCHHDIGPQFEFSRRPGSRGWIVQVYRLTRAGEDLAREVSPVLSQGEISLAGYLTSGSVPANGSSRAS